MFAYLYAIWNIALALEMWEFTVSNSLNMSFNGIVRTKRLSYYLSNISMFPNGIITRGETETFPCNRFIKIRRHRLQLKKLKQK